MSFGGKALGFVESIPSWPTWKKVVVGMVILAVIGAAADAMNDERSEPASAADARGTTSDLAPNEALMTQAELGDEWPLTVDEGIVRCEGAGEVYFEAEGTTYAVNGTAQGASGAPEIDPIWADDPEIEGVKINIHQIIERGLELCE